MKKRPNPSSVALVSALVGLPLLRPADLQAQRPTIEKPLLGPVMVKAPVMSKAATALKFADKYEKMSTYSSIVGINNGAPVYQNPRGELFTLDPATGDMQFLSPDAFAAYHESAARSRAGTSLSMTKWSTVKVSGVITILGVDDAGHVINRNARGEKFYLDPVTGDLVFMQ